MSPLQARTALAKAYASAGFVKRGGLLVRQVGNLLHGVQLVADRRTPGLAHMTHRVHVLNPEQQEPESLEEYGALTASIFSYSSAYPNAWVLETFDPALALLQSRSILQAFQSQQDLAHFWQDRPHPPWLQLGELAPDLSPTHSLNASQQAQALSALSGHVFSTDFQPAPRLGTGLWVSQHGAGGFHHAVQLHANDCASLAYLVWFSVSAADLARGARDTSVASRLMRAPKHVLHTVSQETSASSPELLTLLDWPNADTHAISDALRSTLSQHPPNQLNPA